MDFDTKLPWLVHQIVGAAMGIIFCSWLLGASSGQVALIRLPSTIILTLYFLAMAAFYIRRSFGRRRNRDNDRWYGRRG